MAQVTVTVNGRDYTIACDDGDEEHVTELASYLDERVGELTGTVGQVGEARLLLMVSLLIADELAEAYHELDDLKAGGAGAADGEQDDGAAKAVEDLAARVETVAASLETT